MSTYTDLLNEFYFAFELFSVVQQMCSSVFLSPFRVDGNDGNVGGANNNQSVGGANNNQSGQNTGMEEPMDWE